MPFLGKKPTEVASPVDINSGTIDGATIGGGSPAPATVTTFTSTGIDDNADATAITIDSSENVTVTPSGGVITLGASGQITSKQSLDVATAGGRYIGSTNRGIVGQIRIEQTATGADGGYLEFDTCASGSTSPIKRMRIDSSGRVTTPNQPAFTISSYQNFSVNTTGAQTCSTSNVFSTSSNIVLNYNNGNHFNSSTGRFTAPVDGIYRFDWKAGVADHTSGYFWWYLNKNGTAIVYWQSTQGMSSGSDDVAFMAHHCYVGLSANDYIEIAYLNNYVSGEIYYPSFSGMLVG
tara:strand:- start:2108 stop:2983 length:876 start_codon:yes stop_codon:yes gene_type:complete